MELAVNIFSLRKSASLVLGGALVVSLAVPASAQSGGLNTNGTPNFDVRNVTQGFTPDPMNVNVTSGGSIDDSYTTKRTQLNYLDSVTSPASSEVSGTGPTSGS